MALRDQFEGREFDWFAVDSAGYIAHFSTAGFGPVPIIILETFSTADLLPDEILRLSPQSGAVGHLPGDLTDWLSMAARGLHSFDWQHWDGPYRRAATPETPRHIATLPEPVQTSIRFITFSNTHFENINEFRPEQLCACE